MTTRRIERINELLRREISGIIQREIKDPGIGFTTIMRVETTNDLYYSTVFASVMGEESVRIRTIEHLNKAAGYIKHLLMDRLTMRNIPKISFKLDNSIDYTLRINEVLDKLSREKEKETCENQMEQGDE